jgi:RNA polymerase sigma factor (sigma-70 family)
MSESSEAFAELLERGRQGDQAAMAQLVQQYEFKVRLVARYLLGPALRPYLDSMDLVQSVHRTLMIGLRQSKFAISSPENLITLALTLVRRKAARQWRHMKRQQRFDRGATETSDLSHILNSLCSPQADPARTVQVNDQLQRLCHSLDDTDRRLLELRLDGYSPSEIAQRVGVNTSALYVRLHRLRQRLEASGELHDWL